MKGVIRLELGRKPSIPIEKPIIKAVSAGIKIMTRKFKNV